MCLERKILWILFVTVVSNFGYAVIAPFLPIEYLKKGISDSVMGFIFAVYSAAVVLWSPYVSSSLIYMASKRTIIGVSMFLMGVCFALFGLTDKITNNNILIACVFANRFFQGMCSATMQTTCYAIATNEFPKKKSLIIGLVEAMTGVGLILGPVAGSLLYSSLGFQNCFYVLGGFIIVMSVCFVIFYPNEEGR
jgi:MFS family permease